MNGKWERIAPGMRVTAVVKAGQRGIADDLLSPVTDVVLKSLVEVIGVLDAASCSSASLRHRARANKALHLRPPLLNSVEHGGMSMGWKFWEKRTAPVPASPMQWPSDSYEAVKMLAAFFLTPSVPPFRDWKPDGVQLEPGTEAVAEYGSKGLVLSVWFWQFSQTHGDIAARFARDGFIDYMARGSSQEVADHVDRLLDLIEEGKRGFESLPEDKRTVTAGGHTVNVTFHWSLAIILLTRMHDSPYYGHETGGDADLPVAECLQHAAQSSQGIWGPMLAHIGPFDPSSYPAWRWSSRPGAFERHLQRRHKNPLFPAERRVVTAAEVYYTRVRDAQAIEDVRRTLLEVHQELKERDLPWPWHPYLNGLREKVDAAMDLLRAAGGAPPLEEAAAEMRERLIEVWRLALGDNPEGLAALEAAEAAHRKNSEETTSWVKQIGSPAKPIPPEEVTQSLLSESVEDIARSVSHLSPNDEALASLRSEALRCVMRALAEGHEVPQHRQKLAALGVSI